MRRRVTEVGQKRSGRADNSAASSNHRRRALVVMSLATMAWSAQNTKATTYYWDAALIGTATGGGTGNWDLSTSDWFNGSGDAVWTDTTGTSLVASFGGTAGTVTLGANLGAQGLVFTTSGYTITGSNTLLLDGSGGTGIDSTLSGLIESINVPISLDGPQTWGVGSSSLLTVGGNVSEATPTLLTKSGLGTLVLSGANSFSGGLTLSNGGLGIGSATAIGSGTLTLTGTGTSYVSGAYFEPTTTINNTSGSALTLTNNNAMTWSGSNGTGFTFIGSNDLNLGTGAVTLATASTVTPVLQIVDVLSHNLTVGGAITDNGFSGGIGLVKQGLGTLTLTSAASNFAGGVDLMGGTLSLGTTGKLYVGLGTPGTLGLTNGELSIAGGSTARSQAFSTLIVGAGFNGTTGVIGGGGNQDGLGTITLSASSASNEVTFGTLGARTKGTAVLFRGTNLGTATPGTSGVASILFTSAPSAGSADTSYLAASGSGSLGTTQAAVLRASLVDTSASGTGIGFATYDPTYGVRLLNQSTEQLAVTTTAGYTAANIGDNARIDNLSLATLTGKQTNTLQINNTTGSTITETFSGTASPTNGLLFTGTGAIAVTGGTIAGNGSSSDLIVMSTNTAGVTISSSLTDASSTGQHSITFAGPGTMTVNSLTSSSSGGFFFDGPGQVNLNASISTTSQGLSVAGGTVKFTGAFAMSSARPWKIAEGATIDMDGISVSNVDYLTDFDGAGGSVINSGTAAATLTITNGSTVNTTSNFSGVISGAINLTLNANGSSYTATQVLSGANTYTGTTNVLSGTLRLGSSSAQTDDALTMSGTGTYAALYDMYGSSATVASLTGAATTNTLGSAGSAAILNSVVGSQSVLTINGSANTTYSGQILDNSGTGGTVGLVKSGSGVFTLSGTNNYSGGTKITGGTLVASSATATGTGPVVVSGGGILAGTGTILGALTDSAAGHLSPGVGGIGTLNVGAAGSLTLGASSILDYDFNNTSSDEILDGGSLLVTASTASPVGLNVYAAGTTSKFTPSGGGTETDTLIQYAGGALSSGTLADFSVLNKVAGDTYTFGSSSTGGTGVLTLTINFPASATWTDNASDQSWSTAGNWSTGSVPNAAGATVTFPSLVGHSTTVDLNGNKTVGAITFSGGTYTVDQGSGGTLTLDNNGANAAISSNTGTSQTISAPLSLASTGSPVVNTIISASGTSDKITLSGNISGNGGIIASGLGAVALTGTNTFGGGVSVNSGTVQINNSASLGAGTTTINAGTLEALSSGIVTSTAFALGSASSTIQIDGSGSTYEIDGNITDVSATAPGTLNLASGTGTLILTGSNTYSGGTNIAAGTTVQLGNTAGTLGGSLGTGTVTNNGTINVGASAGSPLGSSSSASIAGSLAGAGPVNQFGGALTLSGANAAYTGTVSVNGGTLVLANGTSTTATGIGPAATGATGGVTLAISGSSTLKATASATIGNNATNSQTTGFSTVALATGTALSIDTGGNNLTIASQITGDSTTTITRTAGTGTLTLGVAGNTSFHNDPQITGSGASSNYTPGFNGVFTNNIGSVSLVARGGGSSGAQWNFAAGSSYPVTIGALAGSINFGSLAGNQPIGASSATSAVRVVVGALNLNSTYTGLIGSTNGVSIGLAKTGTGTFTVTNQNTYYGQALTNAAGSGTAVEQGILAFTSSTAADGSSGPFGATTLGTGPNYVLLGNQTNLGTAYLYSAAAATLANPVVVSGGNSTATTSAYTLTLGGNSANTSSYTGGVTLENNVTISQIAGGVLNETGGITGTDAFTGPDSTSTIDHGETGAATGTAANNSGYQTITFAGGGAINITAANNGTNSYGIYDSNDGGNNNDGSGHYLGANGYVSVTLATSAGTVTFSTPNQYMGNTTINGGTLLVANTSGSATGLGNVTLNGGTLASGTVGSISGAVTAGTGAHTIAPGGIGTVGKLTVGSLTTSSLSTLNFDLGTTPSNGDLLTLTSASTIGANTLLSFGLNSTTPGHYELIGGDIAGINLSNFQLPTASGVSYSLNTSSNSGFIDVVVTSTGPTVTQWALSTGGSWATASDWSPATVPNGQAAQANFLTTPTGITTPATVTLDGNQTVGKITFNNTNSYTITQGTGSGTLTIDDTGDTGGVSPSISVVTGSHSITAPISFANGVTVTTATGSTLTLGGTVTATGTTTVTGSGKLLLGANTGTGFLARTLPALTINSGATLALASAPARGKQQVLITSSLSNSGTLDLSNNDMIVHGGTLSTIIGELKTGFNNGTWNGSSGILSSTAATAAAGGSDVTALGVELNNDGTGNTLLSSFDGQGVSNTDVLVKYTYFGDADLSGTVNGSDYTLIDTGFNNRYSGWHNGDFNYDGVVNGNDYTLIDNAYNNQTLGALSVGAPTDLIAANTAQIADSAAAVPEPASLGLIGIGAAGLLMRRKRRV